MSIMLSQSATYYIDKLSMLPHPEGGFYKEVFRSQQDVSRVGYDAVKQACTSIYYLLQAGDYSAFHRLASDEIWYFHTGEPLHIHMITEQGEMLTHELSDTAIGQFSVIIPAGLWFASEVASASGFALASCAVAPGFDFAEFEMAKKTIMLQQYPQHAGLLDRLCRL